jgi:ribosomal RNA-processing protein 12
LKLIDYLLFIQVMGYLSSPSPHIVSGAIAALSLLIYSDANFCMEVPNLIESVLVLLQHKAIEVIKVSSVIPYVHLFSSFPNSYY